MQFTWIGTTNWVLYAYAFSIFSKFVAIGNCFQAKTLFVECGVVFPFLDCKAMCCLMDSWTQ